MPIPDSRNASPGELAAFTSIIIGLAVALFTMALSQPWYIPVIAGTGTFIFSFSLYYYTLQNFVNRKIKLIYKFINQTKATRREEFYYDKVLPQKTIEEVGRDVEEWADQRRNELEILQANEKFRKEFLMNLSHELRTPVFTMQGYVDTLLSGALEDPQVNRVFLNNASKSIERLVKLLDDLDEISRLESGQAPLEYEQFNIQDLIRDQYDEFSLQAAARNIQLIFKKGTERSLQVKADKAKIRQVLANLISNALKYAGNDATITAGCYVVDGRHVYIEISDDGPGIPEAHLPRIFERFYRADRSRSREVGGTGLGLAIVKHIIEAHGQTVTARSTPGVGSSFGFTLDGVSL